MTTRLPFSRAFVPFCFAAFILVAGACVAAQAPAGATDALTQVMQMRGFAEPFVPLQPNPAAKDSAALVAVLKQHLAARAGRRTSFEALEKYLAL